MVIEIVQAGISGRAYKQIKFRRPSVTMTDAHVQHQDSSDKSSKFGLPGSIYYYFRNNNEYAEYHMDTYQKNGSEHHHKDYLGRVVNKDEGLFFSYKRGYFNFSLETGYMVRPDLVTDNKPESLRLRFGDLWIYCEILRQTGLSHVTQQLMPTFNDTLNALIAFKLSSPEVAYCNAQTWYDRSYAKVLYPKAAISSASISTFLEQLGEEQIYRDFTSLYLSFMNKDKDLSELIAFPILLDSTGMPNSIKIDKTAVSNHSRVINNEIRLIYVVDSDSGLPIFFKAISGNIIDNSTLKTTIALLKASNINVKLIIIDAGYSSK
jgi:hypothetical protein